MPEKWLQWENAQEWGKIYCPMIGNEVMTYYPIGTPAFDSYTAPFIDDDSDVCYYRYDHDEGGWTEEAYCMGEYVDGKKYGF